MQRQTRRGSRSRYISAGARYNEKEDLYIARESAGSARDNLRDNAYANRTWVSPEPVLTGPVQAAQPPVRPMGLLDILIHEIKRDRVSAGLCLILFCLFLALGIVYIGKTASMQRTLREIEQYRQDTAVIERKNEKLERDLEAAKSGERIRNLAQNNLGMLRRERAQVEEIYIQMPEEIRDTTAAEAEEEPKFELLDALLNLIGLLRI